VTDSGVVVVGGGLAGLVAACEAARAGAQVTLVERLSEPGGRARTRDDRGFRFNMGPHALYKFGAGMGILRGLGIEPAGKVPATSGTLARRRGRLHALPGGFASLLSTGLFGAGAKLEAARWLTALGRMDAAAYDSVSIASVLGEQVRHEAVRDLAHALVRVTSYCNDPERMSAGAALRQIQDGLRGVLYLHGGWRSLVDALRAAAVRAGVVLRTGTRVDRVEHDGRAREVVLANGARIPARAVVLAAGPAEVSALVDGGHHPELARHAKGTVAVRVASLEVGLARLTRPRRLFALGIDEPTYFSVHSAWADLAPQGAALVYVARYLAPDEPAERAGLEAELEDLLDAMQPGWRDHVVTKKLLRDLVVVHELPRASAGGLAGRPAARVAGVDGLFLAGDWVGPVGMLADGALASGRDAGRSAARAAGLAVAA
jgi:phytoene dehydrogenase-like protein